MDKTIAVCVIIGLMVIGYFRIRQKTNRIQEMILFATNYNNKFVEYVKSEGNNYEVYLWLIENSPRIQTETDGYGIVALFHLPYSNKIYHNFEIFLNAVPLIKREFDDHSISRNNSAIREYATVIPECLMRHVGVQKEALKQKAKGIKNPIIWFTEGTRYILLIPFSILQWMGIMRELVIRKIEQSGLFKLVAGIVSLLGLISSVVTILVGWNEFERIIMSIINK